MSKSPWVKVGAWAAEAEREEEEEREAAAKVAAAQPPPSFPSLKEAVSTTKQKKNTKMTLQEFTMQQSTYSSSLGGSGGPGVASRADEVDNWAFMKKPISPPPQPRSSSFGSGFSRPEPDRWTRNDPQRLVLDAQKIDAEVVVKVNRPNPFGAAKPREEVLAEKGLDWKKLDLEVEAKKKLSVSGGSRPTSSHSSRPGSAHSTRSETTGEAVVNQRPKVNPFGDAKPREVLLEEKGLDWKKIDLEMEHKRVDRPETEEEKNLKQEIENLRKELLQKSGDEKTNIQELIHKMERELETLVRELDGKVRYSQKIYERPGSGSGRPPSRPGSYEGSMVGYQDRAPSRPGVYEDSRVGFQDQPPPRPGAYEEPRFNYHDSPRSRPGAYEEPRGGFSQRSFSSMGGGYQVDPRAVDYNERPRSQGTVNSWERSDDRRGVQSGGGRGFFGSRDVDRTGSRW